jgi:SAM-dependent methyltransferase
MRYQMDEEENPCIVCGGNQRIDIGYENGFGLFRCSNCGLVNAVGGGYDLEKHYSEFFSKQDEQVWTTFNSVVFSSNAQRISSLIPKWDILDIGCGFGQFLRIMKLKGWRVTGVEPAYEPAQQATKEGLDIRNTLLQDASLQKGSFDVITLWWVLEHVEDPKVLLEQVKGLLRPGGLVVIRVPNISFILLIQRFKFLNNLLSGLKNPVSNKKGFFDILSPPYHLWGFDRKSIGLLMQRVGFKDVEFSLGGRIRTKGWLRDTLEYILYSVSSIVYIISGGNLLFYHDMTVYAKRGK